LEDGSLVTFKGKNGGITVTFGGDADFEELTKVFTSKVAGAKNFFDGSKLSVTFSGRGLTPVEKEILLGIMAEQTLADITENPKETVNIQKTPVIKQIKLPPPPYKQELNSTIFHKGSLRSGQSIAHDGSIVVMGDVNPGSQLTAQGNVIVLGALKGFAHAGCKGDLTAYIAALNLKPTQIRIGDIITYIPKEMHARIKQTIPSYAYVENGQIYIAKLLNL